MTPEEAQAFEDEILDVDAMRAELAALREEVVRLASLLGEVTAELDAQELFGELDDEGEVELTYAEELILRSREALGDNGVLRTERRTDLEVTSWYDSIKPAECYL